MTFYVTMSFQTERLRVQDKVVMAVIYLHLKPDACGQRLRNSHGACPGRYSNREFSSEVQQATSLEHTSP